MSSKCPKFTTNTTRTKMFNVEKKQFDIIVTGAQSKFLPNNYTDLNNSSFIFGNQFPFIYGINPDAIILCVNLTDTIEYIKKTITVIENMLTTKVLFLSLNKFYINEDNTLFNNKTVRAVWDNEQSMWWYSAVDFINILVIMRSR